MEFFQSYLSSSCPELYSHHLNPIKELHMKTLISLSLLFCSFSTSAATFSCVGTEPFWGAKITDKGVHYSDPVSKEHLKITSKKNAIGFAEGASFVVKTKYTSTAVAMGECSDGMSDEVYSHTIVMEKGGVVLSGCCNKN
jgi:uncharacterized membrane protein